MPGEAGRRNKGAQHVVFHDSAHLAMVEEPDRYREVLGSFFARWKQQALLAWIRWRVGPEAGTRSALGLKLTGWALVLAPLLIVADKVLHPQCPAAPARHLAIVAQHPVAWYASHLLLFAGIVLARLCQLAGADPEAIPEWIEVGRERAAARLQPFSGGLHGGGSPARRCLDNARCDAPASGSAALMTARSAVSSGPHVARSSTKVGRKPWAQGNSW